MQGNGLIPRLPIIHIYIPHNELRHPLGNVATEAGLFRLAQFCVYVRFSHPLPVRTILVLFLAGGVRPCGYKRSLSSFAGVRAQDTNLHLFFIA